MNFNDIPVFSLDEIDGNKCPHCHSENTKQYKGFVRVPPISIQVNDIQFMRERDWKSKRHFCWDCDRFYDVVHKNVVTKVTRIM
jgi:nitrate reductase cytochrome c-type subunit